MNAHVTWPMDRAIRCATIMALLAAPVTMLAQSAPAPDPGEPGVTLTVSPPENPAHAPITISGLGYPQAGTPVLITVVSPSGAHSSLNATPDKTGHYSTTFTGTGETGTYKVSAQEGAKGAAVRAEFTIKTYLVDIDDDIADNEAFLEETGAVVKDAKKKVASVPESPARTQTEQKLDALDDQITGLQAQSKKLAQVLQPYRSMVSARPDVEPVLQGFFDHLAKLDADSKAAREAAARQIAQSASQIGRCDAIDHATEALKAVPEMLTIAEKPWQFAAAYMTNLAKSELPTSAGPTATATGQLAGNLPGAAGKPTESLAENELEMGSETGIAEKLVEHIPEQFRATPQYRFVVTETKKFVPSAVEGSRTIGDMVKKASSLAMDVTGFVAGQTLGQLFARYCQKFQGGFHATMVAHFYSTPNAQGHQVEWWGYSTEIHGTLVLRYPKEAAGTAVALTGELQGGATRFGYRENVFSTDLYGAMIKGGKVWLVDAAPAAGDIGSGGLVNAMLSPTSFVIPVTGQFANGKVSIDFNGASTDFNTEYTRSHTLYMVVAPTTLNLPVFGHFSLPYVGAEFILHHIARGDYSVQQAGNVMVIERTRKTEFPGKGNLATYSITLKACNPGCD
ncbi:MAG: hypothetical protein ACREOJ_15355 [Gemmatimonadaceae bacterium]